MNALLTHLRISLIATAVFTLLCCVAYPLLVWGVAQAAFPAQANGSLVSRDGTVVGSALLSQPATAPGYFHPRPSAAGAGHDATASGGTNLGPTSDKLINGVHTKNADGSDDPADFDGVRDLVAAYRAENGLDAATLVPVDAVTRSASGLDPHISVANALLQAPRVARARGVALEAVRALVAAHTEGPALGLLGEAGVNVLRLNLALDGAR